MVPSKLKKGGIIGVIAPSYSLAIISDIVRESANRNFEILGLKIAFGKHVLEKDEFNSSSIQSRIEDLEWAFKNANISAIFTAIGGYNSNQILRYVKWNLIKQNPKIICGYSDITFLLNAIFSKTRLITYYGPHYSTLGQTNVDYTLVCLKKCLFLDDDFKVENSSFWFDDKWWINQKKRKKHKNNGAISIRNGVASGTLVGGHIGSLALLIGTDFMPSPKDTVLFIEADESSSLEVFDRDLQSLIYSDFFKTVRGILIGRFSEKYHKLSIEALKKVIESKKIKIPVIANMDFGHTNPMITIPIGGKCNLISEKNCIVNFYIH